MFVLREYQEECLRNIKNDLNKGNIRLLISLPTGAGKTVIFASLIRRYGKPVLILVHRNELIYQAKEKIEMISGLKVGVLNADNKDFDSYVLVSSIQSLQNDKNLEKVVSQNFQMVIYDEAHHIASDSSGKVLKALGVQDGNVPLIGFTATPIRADGKGLGRYFDKVSYERNIQDLINQDYLVKPRSIKIMNNLNLNNVEQDGKDYSAVSLADVMDTPEINQMIVKCFLDKAKDKKTILFATSISHAKNITALLQEQGIKAVTISGNTPSNKRSDILKKFSTGEIQVICNCQVLTEGFDEPSIECVIVARPTKSTGLYIQMTGRGLRKYPNKEECLVLDFGDTSHSLITTAALLENMYDTQPDIDQENRERAVKELKKQLPPNLNQQLKVIYAEQDYQGRYRWERSKSGDYTLNSSSAEMKIFRNKDDSYSVSFKQKGTSQVQTLGMKVDFQMAFGIAEDHIKNNKEFIMYDKKAEWNDHPATQKQLKFLRKRGYTAGIEDLNRGQAAILIDGLKKRESYK